MATDPAARHRRGRDEQAGLTAIAAGLTPAEAQAAEAWAARMTPGELPPPGAANTRAATGAIIRAAIGAIRNHPDFGTRSTEDRRRSLAITKLEEALLWLGEAI